MTNVEIPGVGKGSSFTGWHTSAHTLVTTTVYPLLSTVLSTGDRDNLGGQGQGLVGLGASAERGPVVGARRRCIPLPIVFTILHSPPTLTSPPRSCHAEDHAFHKRKNPAARHRTANFPQVHTQQNITPATDAALLSSALKFTSPKSLANSLKKAL